MARKVDRIKLRQKLAEHFSKDELATLCFDLEIEYEDLPDTKEALSRELVKECERRVMVPRLLEACQQRRPQVTWDDVFVETPEAGGGPEGLHQPHHLEAPPNGALMMERSQDDEQSEPVVSLLQVLPGKWQLQVMAPYAGVSVQGVFEILPNLTFRAQLMSPMGGSMVQGQWQVSALNQAMFQGQQTNGYQVMPYLAIVQFGQVTPDHLAGVSSAGEQVLLERLEV